MKNFDFVKGCKAGDIGWRFDLDVLLSILYNGEVFLEE
jgi:hypothetical protein